MKSNIRVSVAMAAYNGEKYLKEQLDSILKNLNEDDEIIVCDDGSTDKTLEILKKYAAKDSRIKVYKNSKLGVKKNFEKAIEYARGNYIFLADQDDIWEANKVDKVLKAFNDNGCSLVIHDAVVVNENLKRINNSFFSLRKSKSGILKNLYKNSYIGCCMAFKSAIKKYILPIPNNIEMHDQWIGILNEKYGKSFFLPEKLIKYRRHNANTSSMKHYKISKMIRNRAIFLKEMIRRIRYVKKIK